MILSAVSRLAPVRLLPKTIPFWIARQIRPYSASVFIWVYPLFERLNRILHTQSEKAKIIKRTKTTITKISKLEIIFHRFI